MNKSHKTGRLQDLQSLVGQSLLDLLDMLKILGFQGQAQIAAVDVGALVGVLVVDAGDVAALCGDDPGNGQQLAGLVHQLDGQLAAPAAPW